LSPLENRHHSKLNYNAKKHRTRRRTDVLRGSQLNRLAAPMLDPTIYFDESQDNFIPRHAFCDLSKP
jgi:hypothetical protein